MKSLTSKTLAYRKCKFVYQKLIEGEVRELTRNSLRKLISKYCVASAKMVDEYELRFAEFGFLIRHPTRINVYQVNQKKDFLPDEEQECETLCSNTLKKTVSQNSLHINTSKNLCTTAKPNGMNQQSKTMVYPVEGEKKVTLSFKGYKSIWRPFEEAVWADGFPDICYVEHIFHSAYLSANRERLGRIDVSFKIRDVNFFITVNAPYIVQRPRRKIIRRKIEIIEENE